MSAEQEFRIYVGHLKYTTEAKSLVDEFSKFGKVSKCEIIFGTYKGQKVSRGFGFVTFADKEGQDKALAAADITVDGFKLRVAPARPRRPRDTCFIGGIPTGTTEDDIRACFAAEKPTNVKIVKFDDGQRSGFAFVQFPTADAATEAARKQEIDLKGGKSRVRIARRPFGARPPPGRRFRRRGRRAPKAQQGEQAAGATSQ